MDIDKETSKKIEELQHLEAHFQGILAQIQSMNLDQNEINNAILELNKLSSEEEVYKISFGIMIKSSKLSRKDFETIAGDQNNSPMLFCSPEYSYRQNWGITKVWSYIVKNKNN